MLGKKIRYSCSLFDMPIVITNILGLLIRREEFHFWIFLIFQSVSVRISVEKLAPMR